MENTLYMQIIDFMMEGGMCLANKLNLNYKLY